MLLQQREVIKKETMRNAITFCCGLFNIQREPERYVDCAFDFKSHTIVSCYSSLGVLASSSGAHYLYTALSSKFPLGQSNLAFKPSLSVGYYGAAKGPDLGCSIEFHSSLSLLYNIDLFDVGIRASHMSNAHLGQKNPGLETFAFFLNYKFS